jgi:uncharacterized OB-fold protein
MSSAEETNFAVEAQDHLEGGALVFPCCDTCGLAWLPARRECPRCLETAWHWQEASGEARLVSWAVYHHAFHESVADRVPYLVALVELAEGPRLISTLSGETGPRIEQPLRLRIEQRGGRAAACFEAISD